jgi:hypothetical protein
MDIFVDKNGKKVLTVKDNGDEVRDEKYFQDKRIKGMTDEELVEEYLKKDLPLEKLTHKAKKLLDKCCGGGCDEATES